MGPPTKRVVIIDDSEIILTTVTDELTALGCEVVALQEPSSSLLLEGQKFDLVLMDINMPQAYGDDIARFLKEACGIDAPIYLFSSLPEEELRQRAQEGCADGYFCKSWGVERLVAEVQRILGLSAPREEGCESPPTEDGSQTIYQEFVNRCEERRDKILEFLEVCQVDPSNSCALIERMCLKIHDWMGEAQLLDLNKLGAVAEALNEVLLSWRDRFQPSIHGAQVRSWVDRLADISGRLALEPPDAQLRSELRGLRQELQYELGSGEFVRDPTPITCDNKQLPRRILVFDDSPLVGRALRTELEERGHKVAIASELAVFEQALKDFRPQIIFLDINMPEIRGDELCRRLRKRHQTDTVPIIFLSSLPDQELSLLTEKAGADGYLSKKHGMGKLTQYLDELLSQILF